MEVGGRILRLRERLTGEAAASVLISSATNIRYLTGFTGSNGLLLVTAESATVLTDGRYTEQAPQQLSLIHI